MFKIRLFWKILLWFWLVFALVFSFNIFITQVNSDNVRYRSIPPHLIDQLSDIRRKLEYQFEKHPNASRKKRRFLRNTYLLDSQGQDYFGKETPELLVSLNKRVIGEGAPMTVFKKRFFYFGGVQITDSGQSYRLYISQRFSFLSRDYLGFFLREFAQNLLVSTLLVSFPLSFILAWFFTRPIKLLQLAIKEMSSNLGDKKNLQKLTKRSDEFGDLALDFDRMAVHLEHIINSKTRLLGDVSHELRTPLARLQIAIGLANKKTENPISTELARIKLEADRMNQMISSLLDYSKVDSNTIEPKLQHFNLSQFIELIVKDIEFEAQQEQLNITTEIQPNLNIYADQDGMASCIENILRNALRYAKNKIVISCVTLDLGKYIEIKIRDDGKGVNPEQLEKIFDAFYRPQDDRSRSSGGAGLGLSIAKKVVEAHRGKMTATNIQPSGLEIEIKIPADH